MKKLILLLVVSLFVSSCSQDWLEIPQKGVVSVDDYYKTEEHAEAAIVAVYKEVVNRYNRGAGNQNFSYSPVTLLYNLPSDDLYHGGSAPGSSDWAQGINEFRYTTDNEVVRSTYRSFYMMIYAANLLITNYDQNDPNANIARYVAEARVWRAWCHMMLAIGWKNPPLVTEVLSGDARPTNTPFEEVMDFVINEFADALKYIPSKPNLTDKNSAVRLSKEAVYSFMGKAQVFAGRYADAATNLKTNVIDKNLYDLVPGSEMFNLNHADGDGSVEKVFEFNNYPNTSLSGTVMGQLTLGQMIDHWHWRLDRFVSTPTAVYNSGWGCGQVSGEFARALIANDGFDSHRRKAWFYTYDELLYELEWPSDSNNPTLADKKKDTKRGVDPMGAGLFGNEGYFMMKRVPLMKDKFPTSNITLNNTVIMRYAEVLFLFAEASVRSGQYQAEALAALNKIQQRAGSNHISTSLTLDEIKNEKRFEMWMEGTRWPDIVRWGDAASLLSKQYERIPYFRDLISIDGRTEHEGFVDWEGSDRYNANRDFGFKSNKHELFPYPMLELQVNPNIVQNPGW